MRAAKPKRMDPRVALSADTPKKLMKTTEAPSRTPKPPTLAGIMATKKIASETSNISPTEIAAPTACIHDQKARMVAACEARDNPLALTPPSL